MLSQARDLTFVFRLSLLVGLVCLVLIAGFVYLDPDSPYLPIIQIMYGLLAFMLLVTAMVSGVWARREWRKYQARERWIQQVST